MFNSAVPDLASVVITFRSDSEYTDAVRRAPRFTWEFARVGDDSGWRILTPNRVHITLSKTMDWMFEPATQYQSTLLWTYSLRYLEYLIADHEEYGFANEMVESFATFFTSKNGEERLNSLSSRDHLTAELLHTLAYLGSTEKFTATTAAEQIILSCLAWAVDGNIARNNHGMMLCAGIIQVTRHLDANSAAVFYAYAASQLEQILQEVFDEDGMCSENSPSYHRYYIRFLNDLLSRLPETKLPEVKAMLDHIDSLLTRAQQSLDNITQPDAHLPPLGDGNPELAGNRDLDRYKSEVEVYAPHHGHFSRRTANTYFSFKCGHSSVTHKHCDDTSIYLWVGGEPFILDAGLYNYDSADTASVAIKSQLGHSGAFFKENDQLYPGRMYLPNDPLAHGTMHRDEDGSLVGTATYKELGTITRRVSYEGATITLNDEFSISSKATPVVRFLIPENIEVTLKPHGFHLCGRTHAVDLRVSDGSNFSFADLTINIGGNEAGVASGWQATKFNHRKPAWVVEYAPSASAVSVLTISDR